MRLENYLRTTPGKRGQSDKGQRTILHIVARLRMTEAEILDAAFNSKRIKATPARDLGTGRATDILLEFRTNLSRHRP
jgi:hypothetical protein